MMFRLVLHPHRLSLRSHLLSASRCRCLAKKAKAPKPKKPVYHRGIERASLRSEELLAATFQKPFERSQFDEARSTLNYLRTKPSSNKRPVHGALDLLDRLVREIHEQEQMYRSNWLDFDYVEPFLQNWVQSWREEHERSQEIYEPMALLEKMQAIPWPAHFDPNHKVAETILAGMIEVAHKFDAPEFGEEMLQKIQTVTLEHCNLVLKAWAESNLWNGADQEGLRAFCHSMVQVYGRTPNKESLKIMKSLLGDDEAYKTLDSAISGRSDAAAVLAKAGLLDRAEERFTEIVANNGPVYECASAILDGHQGNVHRAETFFYEIREFLTSGDHVLDLLLEQLVDLYAKDGEYEKAEKAILYARFEPPFAGVIAALKDKPDRIVALVRQNIYDTAVVQAAVESLSSNLFVDHAISVLRLVEENKSDSPARLVDELVRGIALSKHPDCGKFAYQIFQETKALQILPNFQSIHGIVQSCLQAAMLRESDVVAGDFVTFESLDDAKVLFDCWALLGTRADARDTRKQFNAIENPGVFAFQVLLYSIVMSSDPNTGSELFGVYEEIKQSGHSADNLCVDIIMSFCCQSEEIEDLQRAQALFDSIETRKRRHYELLATGWLRMNEPKRAREVLFRQVEDYNNRDDGETICPSQELISAITKKFLQQKRLLKAHHFVEDITDLWLAKYLPEPPHKIKTIRPLLDAWGMSSYHGKDVYIEDILNDFAGFDEEESQTQSVDPCNFNPFQAPGDRPGNPDDEPKLFYEMDGLSDDEDKEMFPDAIDNSDPLGDVELESDSGEEEEEEKEPDWVIRRRGYYGNMPDDAFEDSSDDECNTSGCDTDGDEEDQDGPVRD